MNNIAPNLDLLASAQRVIAEDAQLTGAYELAVARAYWRRHRALVEAPEWPATLDEQQPALADQVFCPNFEGWLQQEAERIATAV